MSAFFWIIAAVVSRIMPHPWWSFTAVGAGLLYFGSKQKLRFIWIPVAALAATDYYLTVYTYNYPFHVADYLLTWAWYAAIVVLGTLLLSKKITVLRVGSGAVLASTSFFLISNYAVWVSSAMYPHTLGGLATCYVAGLPFYGNNLCSTLLFSAIAFGLPALGRKMAECRAANQHVAL